MTERPIIFSAPMVKAILDGRKTQTRRIVKLTDSGRVKEVGSPKNWHLDDPDAIKACPYGVPGDRLWVREAWSYDPPDELWAKDRARLLYREGYDHPPEMNDDEWPRWKSPIHCPRWASRITLEIVDVRVERVQEISEEDAIAEGIERVTGNSFRVYERGAEGETAPGAISSYRSLWDSINGKRAPWESNPYVWAITFKRVP